MSDSDLRDLERRWRESGSTEDEATLLMAYVRNRDLTRGRLELAALCGNLGAIQAIGAPPVHSLTDWAGALGVWDREAGARILVSAIEAALPILEGEFPRERRHAEFLDVIKDWIRCPCTSHQELVSEHSTGTTWTPLAGSWELADREALPDAPARVFGALSDASQVILRVAHFGPVRRDVQNGLLKLIPFAGEARIRAAVLEAVSPWALGRSDPLRLEV